MIPLEKGEDFLGVNAAGAEVVALRLREQAG